MGEINRHEQDALVAALEATVRQLTEANAELKVELARLAEERDAAQDGQTNGWVMAGKLNQYTRHKEDCTLSLVNDTPCSCGLATLRVITNLATRAALGPA